MKKILALLTLAAAVCTATAQETPADSLTPEQLEALRAAALEAASNPGATAQPPGTPTVAAPAPTPTATPGATVAAAPEPRIIRKGEINFPGADINMVLDVYAEMVDRTILRPASLPATAITLKTQTDLTDQELIMALDAVLALNGISMINIGDRFVKAVPMAQAGQEGAPVSPALAASLPDLGQFLTHVVQLKHVKVSEALPALQPFAKIPNSVLAIESVNMIVLRDFTENVKRMLEMLERIDVAVDSDFVSEVIPIKYALAGEIANALNSLSTGGGATTVGGGGMGGGGMGGGVGGLSSGSRSRGGMGNRMSTRPVGGGYPGVNTGYYPQQVAPGAPPGAAAGSFTDRLRSIINKASTSGDLEILGQTRIIADERTNSLLIFAGKKDMAMIKDIISKLDVVLAQVLIEALVIEVGLGNDLAWGISYLSTGKETGDWTSAGGVFNNVNFLDPDKIRGATNLLGGFSYYAKYKDDLLVAVTAAARDNNISVLSRPRVQTSHAVEANLFVGETRPYPTGSSFGGAYGGFSQIQQQRIGIELNVLPLINPDGLVVMEIAQNIQSVGGEVFIENVGQVPITQDRSANAMVAVKSGETIVLGGFISADKSYTDSGVPFLKDIPGLGLLFRAQATSKNRRELMIFIKPTVLETPEVAARVAIEEKNRMPGVLGAERELTKDYEDAMRKLNPEAVPAK